MERNCWNYPKDVVGLIDCLTSSEGNFSDESFEKIAKDEIIYEKIRNGLDEIITINIVDKQQIENKYEELQKIESQIEKNMLLRFPTIKEGYQFVKNITSETGFFLKKAYIAELMNKNTPNCTLECIEYKDTVNHFIDEYGSGYLMALTRLYEGVEWHKRTYEYYKNMKCSHFEERPIDIIYIKKSHIKPLYAYMGRVPMWEDKIGGSIFIYNVDEKIVPLRFLSKYYHYIKELKFHTDIMRYFVANSSFQERFIRYFLQSEQDEVGFFEPHCLMEARCWEYSMKNLKIIASELEIEELKNFSGKSVIMDIKGEIMLSDNLIDSISNNSKNRRCPGHHRMFSMLLKYHMFMMLTEKIEIDQFLVENADVADLWKGYENENNINY